MPGLITISTPATASAGPLTLVSDDGSQTRTLALNNDGRAYMTGNNVVERVLGSRVGSTTSTYADRVAGTTYQVSSVRPARVTVMITLVCPLGDSASAALQVGDDAGTLVEQDKEMVSYSGVVSQVLGITPTLTFNNTRATKLVGDLSPGQLYKVVTTKSGSASVSITAVKERVF